MIDDFITVYRVAIQKEILKYSEQLASGKVEDYMRYREVVGKISGLKEALAVYKQCIKLRGEGDDEDE